MTVQNLELRVSRVRFLANFVLELCLSLAQRMQAEEMGEKAAKLAANLERLGRHYSFLVRLNDASESLRNLVTCAVDTDSVERLIELAGDMFEQADTLCEGVDAGSDQLQLLHRYLGELDAARQVLARDNSAAVDVRAELELIERMRIRGASIHERACSVLERQINRDFVSECMSLHLCAARAAVMLATAVGALADLLIGRNRSARHCEHTSFAHTSV